LAIPTADEQIDFLTKLQRLLADGQFVATYKYALLLALADLAVETGDDDGSSLVISTKQIASKFIQYYWRQVLPYLPRQNPAMGQVLRQNTGTQAAIIGLVLQARRRFDGSLTDARRDTAAWKALERKVDQVVRQMPLWKLQTIGRTGLDFLYENRGSGNSIELRTGIAFCLRKFYPLVSELVRSDWTRYIRRNNLEAFGTTSELAEFLFGSERNCLLAAREVLEDVQSGRCFYCKKAVPRRKGHVDHFIPWSRYPVDLGHNFVVAHDSCNSAKADHLAAADYLSAWVDQNVEHRLQLAEGFEQRQIMHDWATSIRVAQWAYGQAAETGGMVWAKKNELVKLDSSWDQAIKR